MRLKKSEYLVIISKNTNFTECKGKKYIHNLYYIYVYVLYILCSMLYIL